MIKRFKPGDKLVLNDLGRQFFTNRRGGAGEIPRCLLGSLTLASYEGRTITERGVHEACPAIVLNNMFGTWSEVFFDAGDGPW